MHLADRVDCGRHNNFAVPRPMKVAAIATPEDREAWSRYLENRDGVTAFTQPQWVEILRDTYGSCVRLFGVRDGDGRLIGGSLVYHYPACGRALFTPPFGFIADHPEAAARLVEAISQYAEEAGIASSDINYGMDAGVGECPAGWSRTSFLLPVGTTEDAFWRALPSKARNTIRKSQRQDVLVDEDPAALDRWYEIYVAHCVERRLPVHQRSFFERILTLFGRSATLLSAYKDGKLVAGTVFLTGGRFAHYLFSASVREALPLGANSLLMHEFANKARQDGVEAIELGESREGGGVYTFKRKQLGAEPVSIHHADIVKTKRPHRPTPTERLLAMGQRSWPLLPESLKSKCMQGLRPFHKLI